MKEYKAGIYLRLSHEDINTNNSIEAQKDICKAYIASLNNTQNATHFGGNITTLNNISVTLMREYVDNGYSGILDSRPALNEMMVDAVQKKINMVIVKDLSRLTRDKNKTGYYTEMFFPDNDVRFISVTEYIDSGERYEIDDSIMLRGIINQSYLSDLSKKVKSVKNDMKNEGKYVEYYTPYGYKKDSEDKYKVVIDEKVIDNVKLIFDMYLQGFSLGKIAKHLSSMGIDTPKKYKGLKVAINEWRSDSIGRILKDPFYVGKMIINKSYSDYRTKKIIKTPKKEWIFIENHHEAIVSQEDFDKVQDILENSFSKPKRVYEYLLRDLVYCGHCKAKMQYKYRTRTKVRSKPLPKEKQKQDWYYKCRMIYRFPSICDRGHTIKEDSLNSIVLAELKKRLQKIKIDESTNKIINEYKKRDVTYKMLEKYLNSKRKIENEMRILYNKKVEETIDTEKFKERYNILKQDLKEVENNITILQEQHKDKIADSTLKDIILDFKSGKEFDNGTIKKLISRIEIYEDKTIDITFNF